MRAAVSPGAPRLAAGIPWSRDLARSDMEMSCPLSRFEVRVHKTRAAAMPGPRRKDEIAESVAFNFLPPIRIQAIHSGLTIRTRLVRLLCPRRRRSWTVTRLRRRASRRAFLTVVRHVPALAAMVSMCRPQTPWWRTSSETIRRAAISAWVNLAARAGGIGPEAARCRRRAMLAWRSGERCRRAFGGGGAFGALASFRSRDGLRSGLGVIVG